MQPMDQMSTAAVTLPPCSDYGEGEGRRYFRGEVENRTAHRVASLRQVVVARCDGAEVGEHDVTRLRDQNVLCLQVAVDQVGSVVEIVDCLDDL